MKQFIIAVSALAFVFGVGSAVAGVNPNPPSGTPDKPATPDKVKQERPIDKPASPGK